MPNLNSETRWRILFWYNIVASALTMLTAIWIVFQFRNYAVARESAVDKLVRHLNRIERQQKQVLCLIETEGECHYFPADVGDSAAELPGPAASPVR